MLVLACMCVCARLECLCKLWSKTERKTIDNTACLRVSRFPRFSRKKTRQFICLQFHLWFDKGKSFRIPINEPKPESIVPLFAVVNHCCCHFWTINLITSIRAHISLALASTELTECGVKRNNRKQPTTRWNEKYDGIIQQECTIH